jgi:hypothetical protein
MYNSPDTKKITNISQCWLAIVIFVELEQVMLYV